MEMERSLSTLQIWLWVFIAVSALVALTFVYVDLPVAQFSAHFVHLLRPLRDGLGSAIILSVEIVIAAVLILARLLTGKLSPFFETLAIACLASICTYSLNSNVLKVFFGVPNPGKVSRGAEHAFHLFMGTGNSSFPSGHMALAASFAGVFISQKRVGAWPVAIALCLGAGLLVIGRWHFLSDVIAGTFLGLWAGLIAGELWKVHSGQRPQ